MLLSKEVKLWKVTAWEIEKEDEETRVSGKEVKQDIGQCWKSGDR